MTSPWHQIPLADYEAHMAMPSVAQAQLLGTTLQRVVSTFRPRSLAILGAAGGNGLELIDSRIVRRVVAVDINQQYLEVCTNRHAASFAQFEPVLHDLVQGPPPIEPVECVFAGLVLEYLAPEPFCDSLPSFLAEGGFFAILLQLPSPNLPEVSPSPYHSLAQLQSAFSFVNPAQMDEALGNRGFTLVTAHRFDRDSGKSFHYAAYQRDPIRLARIGE
jgi:hypothetical protein